MASPDPPSPLPAADSHREPEHQSAIDEPRARPSLDEPEHQSDSDFRDSSTPSSPLFTPPDTDFTDGGSVSFQSVTDDDSVQDFELMTSPAPSTYSLTDSLLENSFRKEFGRSFNNYSDIYVLPADDPEIERLNKQHRMLEMVMGRYPPPMPELLAPEPGMPKMVLDLGCGTGCWLIDVATDFPHVECVGVDLVPMQAQNTGLPRNMRTEVDDVNLGLEHFYGQFDVVNARLISAGIKDYAGLVDQCSRVLRPDGLLIMAECDFIAYDKDHAPFVPAQPALRPDTPAVARFMHYMRQAVRARGGNLDAAPLLKVWVGQHRAFDEPVHRDIFFPLTAFPEDPFQRRVGELCSDDFRAFMSSGRPVLLKTGMPEHEVDALLAAGLRELESTDVPVYMRVQCIYARRR